MEREQELGDFTAEIMDSVRTQYRQNAFTGRVVARAVIRGVEPLGDCRFSDHHSHLLSFHFTTVLRLRPLLFC